MKLVCLQTCKTNAPQSLSLFCLPTFCNIKERDSVNFHPNTCIPFEHQKIKCRQHKQLFVVSVMPGLTILKKPFHPVRKSLFSFIIASACKYLKICCGDFKKVISLVTHTNSKEYHSQKFLPIIQYKILDFLQACTLGHRRLSVRCESKYVMERCLISTETRDQCTSK